MYAWRGVSLQQTPVEHQRIIDYITSALCTSKSTLKQTMNLHTHELNSNKKSNGREEIHSTFKIQHTPAMKAPQNLHPLLCKSLHHSAIIVRYACF
jgi:hypothetical protein